MIRLFLLCLCIGVLVQPADASSRRMTLDAVQHWVYVIQGLDRPDVAASLLESHFDLYVLEPTVSERGMEDFDIAGLVAGIRAHNIAVRGVDPLILAYVDIGQAEAWRWYFDPAWSDGDGALTDAAPDWITGTDPDNWVDNFPVAFWHPDWQAVMTSGVNGRSHIDITLAAGFDGIYMDWVEAFSDDTVRAYLQRTAGVDDADSWDLSAALMLDFITGLRDYARDGSPLANPDYLLVAQNATDLRGFDPDRYDALIDAIAIEGLWYDGVDGDCNSFDDWDCQDGYNVPAVEVTDGWSREILEEHLAPILAHDIMPLFCAEYAQDVDGSDAATQVYTQLAPGICVPYATRRPLDRIATMPYPPTYDPDAFQP